jgi:hypothetical protein
MSTYKIVGGHRVADHEPGDTLTTEDLAGLNVDHLIEAGHIEANTIKAAKADATTQED